MASPHCDLYLTRDAETAWQRVIRPWLNQPGRLRRDYVVVPTRGQAHALKQRCLRENLPLLGVEFLSPGLARKKWHSLEREKSPPALGRELLLLGLRRVIAARLKNLSTEEEPWGMLKTLQSDPERALDDFDELLDGGFSPSDFPHLLLADVFGEFYAWVKRLGYEFSQQQDARAALTAPSSDASRIGDRLLIYGLSAEAWGEFFNVAALARRGSDVTVVLPDPEFGRKQLDEKWIRLWETLLGVEPQVLDPVDVLSGDAVAEGWTADAPVRSSPTAEVLVGMGRTDEAELIAQKVADLLSTGAEDIGVIFPAADPVHLRVATHLVKQGIDFADMIETKGAPPAEVKIQTAILNYYEQGGRLEQFLEIWARLRPLDLASVPLGAARRVSERLFDENQTHRLADYLDRLEKADDQDFCAVWGVAKKLSAWPTELTLSDALEKFEKVCEDFVLPLPPGWEALKAFAERETELLPVGLITTTLRDFLPDASPVPGAPGKGCFARVTLTTRRRAEGVVWSDLILCESNAGLWPLRIESSPWLPDAARSKITERGRFSLGLFTADDRYALEKAGYASLARNTRGKVVFSGALSDEENTELKLGPNSWVERVLFAQVDEAKKLSLEGEWGRRARAVEKNTSRNERETAEKTENGAQILNTATWRKIWQSRRNAHIPFNEYFYSADSEKTRPGRLPARLVERAVTDPVELWYEAVLGVRRIEWAPLTRGRKKAVGQLAHRLLAQALRGLPAEGDFCEVPTAEESRLKLDAALKALRSQWPNDRYWDSFHAELTQVASALLTKVQPLAAGRFAVLEWSPPRAVLLPVPGDGALHVYGRIDLALSDRPQWDGSDVVLVDFKTGADKPISVKKMSRGESLQLGLYLAMARALGARSGRVWLIKPDGTSDSALEMEQLDAALRPLKQIHRHINTGRYGQLTVDRTDYTYGYVLPLACAPIARAILVEKFAETFPETIEEGAEDA